MLLISLATYDPRDPAPFFKAGAAGPRATSSGPSARSWPSCSIPQLFGMAALLLPLVLGRHGLEALLVPAHRGALHQGRRASSLLLLVAHRVPDPHLRHRARRGRAGARGRRRRRAARRAADRELQPHRAPTSWWPPRSSSSLILATQFSFAAFLHAARAAASASGCAALRTAWAHFRETRRKEKMRREVIRKHTPEGRGAPSGCRGSAACARRKATEPEPRTTTSRARTTCRCRPPRRGAGPAQKPLPFAAPTRSDDPAPPTRREPERAAPRRRAQERDARRPPRRSARQLHAAARSRSSTRSSPTPRMDKDAPASRRRKILQTQVRPSSA